MSQSNRLKVMDVDWTLGELRKFIGLAELRQPHADGIAFIGDFGSPVGREVDIIASAQVVEQILDRVLPRWRIEVPDDGKKRWAQHRQACIRAVTALERQAELAERLGDNAPSVNAGDLHEWVWSAARSLWQSGHYRESVRAASMKVNAEAQNKVGRRDVSETDLFRQAYSDDDPQPGKPRLRPAGDDGGKTAKSVRRGTAALAEGCFAVLRNPSSHELMEELTEQEALEQLATWSVLARLLDGSTLVTA